MVAGQDQATELNYVRFSLEQLLQSGQAALEHLDAVQGVITIQAGDGRKRRGRKPKALVQAEATMGTPTTTPKRRGRPPGSGNGRRGRKPKTATESAVEKIGASVQG